MKKYLVATILALGLATMAKADNITITVPVDVMDDYRKAFAQTYGYQTDLPGPQGTPTPNPENRNQFAKRKIGEYVVNVINAWRADQGRSRAAADVAATPTPNIQ